MGRTKGVGFISLEDMLDLGVTGPMLRAAGLKMDVRKDEPYSSYEKFDFEVPTRTENDVYARYRVRIEEMRQSARIIRQALEGMPEGPWQADAPHVVLPDREKMKTQMEALIYHFKIVTEGFRVPAGEVYQVIESPRGEIGYYVVSDGTSKPYRVHMRTPSFGNLQALPKMVEGTLIADVIASHRQHGFRPWETRTGNDIFAATRSNDSTKLLKSYPPGRQRSAVMPMLLYAQDEVGAVTQRTGRGSGHARCGVHAAAGGRSGRLLLDAAPQAAGEVSRAGLHQYQLPAGRRRQSCTSTPARSSASDTRKSPPTASSRSKKWSAWAPAPGRRRSQVNYDFHHYVTPEKLDQLIDGLRKTQ